MSEGAERFVVTFEVDVFGAEGGWNAAPILDAVREVMTGPTPASFAGITIERKHARRVVRDAD